MEFLTDYGLFLAKAVTFLIVFALVVAIAASAGHKEKGLKPKIIHLNKKLKKVQDHINSEVLSKKELKEKAKLDKASEKAKNDEEPKPKTYVLDFNGDIKASQAEQLKDEITAILSIESPVDEVVVKVESGGGMVHQYGFASAQLDRIKKQGIPLTVCVDKVAASGGYMMAVVADKIVAAPFAILGSIGVIAQLPNFNKILKKNDIDFEVHTAGEYKRTLTMFGENTDKAREKFKEDLKDVHVMFKDFVKSHRDVVDVEAVANGDVWYGKKAIEQNLVDELMTSDDYLLEKTKTSDVYLITREKKKNLAQKLGLAAKQGVANGVEAAIEKMSFSKWYL